MGTTKASAAKADRLNTARAQSMQHLAEGIADIMEIRGFLPGTATAHQGYVSVLKSNHFESLSRFSIALDLHTPIINALAEAKQELDNRNVALAGLRNQVVIKDNKIAEMIGVLSATEREVISQRNHLGKLEDQAFDATALIQTLREQNAQLNRKLEDAAAAPNLKPFGDMEKEEEEEEEALSTYDRNKEARRLKYIAFWYKLRAVYGHRVPTKGEMVTIGVPYELWSEIMVARQDTYDVRTPDHGKPIGCKDFNSGKEYPDAVPIDLYFRQSCPVGFRTDSKESNTEPKSHLVWFYPVIR